jgi:hypothetical protein
MREYPDLKNIKNKKDVIEHYSTRGIFENRKYFPIPYLKYDVLNSMNLHHFESEKIVNLNSNKIIIITSKDADLNMLLNQIIPPTYIIICLLPNEKKPTSEQPSIIYYNLNDYECPFFDFKNIDNLILDENDIIIYLHGKHKIYSNMLTYYYITCYSLYECDAVLSPFNQNNKMKTNIFRSPFQEECSFNTLFSFRYKHMIKLYGFYQYIIRVNPSIKLYISLILTFFYKHYKIDVVEINIFNSIKIEENNEEKKMLTDFFINHLNIKPIYKIDKGNCKTNHLLKKIDNINYIKKHDNYLSEDKVQIHFYNESIFILTIQPEKNQIENIILFNSINKINLILPIENKKSKKITFFIKMDELQIVKSPL